MLSVAIVSFFSLFAPPLSPIPPSARSKENHMQFTRCSHLFSFQREPCSVHAVYADHGQGEHVHPQHGPKQSDAEPGKSVFRRKNQSVG